MPTIQSVKASDNQVTVSVKSTVPIQSASLHFTSDTGAWQKRKWQTKKATIDNSTIQATLPEERPMVYFMTVTDQRGAWVSTEHKTLTK